MESTPNPDDGGYEEVERVQNFAGGAVRCIGCGHYLYLYYNGGELDSATCCDYVYRTEIERVDLVIYKEKA